MRRTIKLLSILLLHQMAINAQSDIQAISMVLTDYIEGTANGEPDRLRSAFHPDFNLYFVQNDSLNIWSGDGYIDRVQPGKKSNRIGKIVSIDQINDAASAKVEILLPGRKRIYTDFFLLLKLEGKWKIIHKSFTYIPFPE